MIYKLTQKVKNVDYITNCYFFKEVVSKLKVVEINNTILVEIASIIQKSELRKH